MKKWLAVVLAALLLASCASPDEPENQEAGALIYYLAPEEEARGGDRIRSSRELLDLPEDADELTQAQAVVERLLAGSSDGALLSPLPEGAELLGLEVRDRMAYVDLGEPLRELSGVDLTLADYCLTLSLTELESIQAVVVTARGRAVGQQPKLVFYERDVLLSDRNDLLQTVEVTLYFLDANGALVPEKRALSLYEGQTLAEALVSALLEGPESRELQRAIPEDFSVSYVRVDSGTCYVSLPAAALELLPEEERAQRMILWSLAESLYSIDSIEEIRLLADGEELELFGQVAVESIGVRAKG